MVAGGKAAAHVPSIRKQRETHAGAQLAVGWCHPHSGWVSPPPSSLSLAHPDVCVHDDSESSQVYDAGEASWADPGTDYEDASRWGSVVW